MQNVKNENLISQKRFIQIQSFRIPNFILKNAKRKEEGSESNLLPPGGKKNPKKKKKTK